MSPTYMDKDGYNLSGHIGSDGNAEMIRTIGLPIDQYGNEVLDVECLTDCNFKEVPNVEVMLNE